MDNDDDRLCGLPGILTTGPGVPGSFTGATRFPEK
jgi:hypothetical protein